MLSKLDPLQTNPCLRIVWNYTILNLKISSIASNDSFENANAFLLEPLIGFENILIKIQNI